LSADVTFTRTTAGSAAATVIAIDRFPIEFTAICHLVIKLLLDRQGGTVQPAARLWV